MHLPAFLPSDRPFLPINLGGNPFGWTADRDATYAVLDRFLEGGGSFVDTADAYSCWVDGHEGGESERLIGDWMRERDNRDDVVVATKVCRKPGREGLAHDNVVAALDESLERLGTDRIDLYYAHYDDEDVPVAEQVATFSSLVASGKVRAVGLSNFSPERMREWFGTARERGLAVPQAIQPRYTLVSREVYERDYAPIAAEFGAAVFSYPALASGFLTGKYRTEADFEGAARGSAARRYAEAGGLAVVDALVQVGERHGAEPATVALAWLLAKGVTAPIASVSRPEQLDAILAAPALRLSPQDVAELDEASAGF
ncbi:aldo/keto reductase [Ornithinimicrobium flavum]|uniref:aldo/keto reductase n=1 Tax=Ornithinimicrobium flavum TaxID=1288636 RepID=UPI00106F1438|nr:aldo/keto reductase [Ornithinimicrobium flavum]